MLKSRIAVRDSATSDVMTTAEGNAAHCRGHLDCAEIIRGNATASNVPHVVVRREQASHSRELIPVTQGPGSASSATWIGVTS